MFINMFIYLYIYNNYSLYIYNNKYINKQTNK